ncbi:hypothetical protein SLE2022_224870 [Rubroshorea leprosula]
MDAVSSSRNDMNDDSTSGGEAQGGQAQPVAVQSANAPPPFLSKTYDMVDDPATDAIVSWSLTNNSFVVWNTPEFARDLLPKYFKHNNFSSFVRQLNTYGFRKVDPDRWEFANEGFLRGQKHLLKGITRRKPAHGNGHQQPQQSHGQSSSVGPCVEVGKFGIEEEIERLKRDKNVLMQELVRLRQQQQSTDNQLQKMVQQFQGMEQRQQQMMSFLAKAVQSPGFLAQFVQQQNESNRRISETNKKRRLKQDGVIENEHSGAPDGQIVKYQPYMNDTQAMIWQFMKTDSSQLESFNNNHENFLLGDCSSSSSGVDSGSSPDHIRGVTFQEVPPTSRPSTFVPAGLGISGQGPAAATSEVWSSPHATTSEKVSTAQFPDMSEIARAQESPSISSPSKDVIMTELTKISGMVPERAADIPAENYFQSETGGDRLSDQTSMDINSSILSNAIPRNEDIDALLADSNFWENIFVQSPVPEDIEPNSVDGRNKRSEGQVVENGWDNTQPMDKLTEKMGFLTSDRQGV